VCIYGYTPSSPLRFARSRWELEVRDQSILAGLHVHTELTSHS